MIEIKVPTLYQSLRMT